MRKEESNLAKLKEAQVKTIRRVYASGKKTLYEVGLRYGVTAMAISKIVNRKVWKHI